MPLTNQQYDSIIRTYEEKQNQHNRQLEKRTQEIYMECPQYRELDERVASLGAAYARKLLAGDDSAPSRLKEELAAIASQKALLLENNGYPADYLLTAYECPDCKDTGYLNAKKCHCFRQKMITFLYEQSNIQEQLRTENFDHLSTEYYEGPHLQRFEAALQGCHEFIENFNTDYQNLLFCGTVGTGKSFLSSCITKELIERGFCVIYFSSAALFEKLSQIAFDYRSKEELALFYEDIYSCDLVIIDDLGTELTNAFVSSQLFSFLNERHIRKKSTLISTNLSLEEIRDRYSDRIFSRITSNYGIYKLTGPDIRMYKTRMKNRK